MTIENIRKEIDRIDYEIIKLLSRRHSFVKQASLFKNSEKDVKAENRVKEVFETRKNWAKDFDLDPDFIEMLYKTIINYFIAREMEEFNKK